MQLYENLNTTYFSFLKVKRTMMESKFLSMFFSVIYFLHLDIVNGSPSNRFTYVILRERHIFVINVLSEDKWWHTFAHIWRLVDGFLGPAVSKNSIICFIIISSKILPTIRINRATKNIKHDTVKIWHLHQVISWIYISNIN